MEGMAVNWAGDFVGGGRRREHPRTGMKGKPPSRDGAAASAEGREGMPQATGQGVMCQISLAYSAMVRSVLNLPELAMFIRHMRAQREGCS